MSQLITAATPSNSQYTDFKTKIPSLSDQANVVEAFKLYHYGRDNYDGSIPPAEDSIYGHFLNLDTRINVIEGTPSGGGTFSDTIPLEIEVLGSDDTDVPEGFLWVDSEGIVISENFSSTAIFTNSQPDDTSHGLVWVDKDANLPFLNVSNYATAELVASLENNVAILSSSFSSLPPDLLTSQFFKYVGHGINANTSREAAPIINWNGEITPLNIINGDFWYRNVRKVGVTAINNSTPNVNPILGTTVFNTGTVAHGLIPGDKVRFTGLPEGNWSSDPNGEIDYEITSVTTGIIQGNTFTITGLALSVEDPNVFPIVLSNAIVIRQSNVNDVGRSQNDKLYAYVDNSWKQFAFVGEFVDPASQPTLLRWSIVGENNQTTLFGVDIDDETLSYIPGGYEQVFIDGQLLSASAYTASSGFAIELNDPLNGGEVIEIFAYGVFDFSKESFENYTTSQDNIISQRFFSYV